MKTINAHLSLASVAAVGGLVLCELAAVAGQDSGAMLWDPAIPFPAVGAVATVPGVDYRLVHARTQEWQFLHEPRIAWHKGTLHVSFSHAPVKESEPAQEMHGRRSRDRGLTWSEPEVIAAASPGEWRTETAPMLSLRGTLWAFVGRYGGGAGYSKNSLGMTRYRLNSATNRFELVSPDVNPQGFIPFVQPQRLGNGNWIIGGHTDKVRHAAVAISKGNDMSAWRVKKLETPQPAEYPETSLISRGKRVVAIIRHAGEPDQSNGTLTALAAESMDYGETFGPVRRSNLPMRNSKPFSGTLSTGQSYVLFNAADGPVRNALMIAVTDRRSVLPFRRAWKVIEGSPDAISPELAKLGESSQTHRWAYPEAVEKDGVLYVTFSQNNRHCWVARIPVASLKVN
ncbi:MAG: sialidase family protein [Planctomycetota bacterium]